MCSDLLDELQLYNALHITIIHPAADKGMNKFLQILTETKLIILAMFLR